MKHTLSPGLIHESELLVTEQHLVPALFPHNPQSQIRPPVLATGFLAGFLELTCVELIIPHLDWPREQAVGVGIAITHQAATPPGMTIRARALLTNVQGRQLQFRVEAWDQQDLISQGTHERVIIDRDRFVERVYSKLNQVDK